MRRPVWPGYLLSRATDACHWLWRSPISALCCSFRQHCPVTGWLLRFGWLSIANDYRLKVTLHGRVALASLRCQGAVNPGTGTVRGSSCLHKRACSRPVLRAGQLGTIRERPKIPINPVD
ncbi:hypothetical protein BR93DRAFT_750649 [Coniochaeta sp. PMI_546]|nr:hypothetical protein BR93DRAFT_750649 [Coniochaeta sp. PMI_546]